MTSLKLEYRNIGGYHELVSDEVPGLYVLQGKFTDAILSASDAIPPLLEAKGITCRLRWEKPILELEAEAAREFPPATPDTVDKKPPLIIEAFCVD